MTDKEIIKALEHCSSDEVGLCHICPLDGECNGDITILLKYAIDLINRQQEQLEATIAGQETLQKALAKKDREVAELNSDLKLLRNDYDYLKEKFDKAIEKNIKQRDKVVRLTVEKDSLIKTFGECQAEATKSLAENDKEIERLKSYIYAMTVTMHNSAEATRAEAVREFAERLKGTFPSYDFLRSTERIKIDIDNLVKEMAGNKE